MHFCAVCENCIFCMEKGAAAGCVLETDLTQHASKNAEVGETAS